MLDVPIVELGKFNLPVTVTSPDSCVPVELSYVTADVFDNAATTDEFSSVVKGIDCSPPVLWNTILDAGPTTKSPTMTEPPYSETKFCKVADNEADVTSSFPVIKSFGLNMYISFSSVIVGSILGFANVWRIHPPRGLPYSVP